MSASDQNVRLSGRAASPGMAIGRAYIYREKLETLADSYDIEEYEIGEEIRRIEQAIEVVAEDLKISAQRIEKETSPQLASIFEVHQAMLQDQGLRQEIQHLIEEEWIRAEHALARAFHHRERRFRQMPESIHQHHADDIADLARRLLREMAGVKATSLEKIPPGRVLVARRLLPSDTVALSHRAVAGIVTEVGGPGSHVALLAEAFGIPTVTQVPEALQQIKDNDLLIVASHHGQVVINPDSETIAHYEKEHAGAQSHQVELLASAQKRAKTRSGLQVTVMANVSCLEDTAMAAQNGADGIGLYRIEQFYLSRKTPPTPDELLTELRSTFAPFQGKPITIRLLDLGGDKPLPFLKLPPENNPFLGLRGVRFLLKYPDLLDTQLRALLQLSHEQEVRLLVPMVTFPEDMARVRDRLKEVMRQSGENVAPPLGAMIETPAAALSVPELKAYADFFSIGTNDLTQYTVAAGRENPMVSEYYQEDHPTVLRLLSVIVQEAESLPIGLCGELARQINVLPQLLRIGIHDLSVAPPLVPVVKEAIRNVE